MENNLSRRPRPRRLLLELLGAAALGALVLAGAGGPGTVQGAPGRAAAAVEGPAPADTDRVVVPAPADPLLYRDSLHEPLVVRSHRGVLEATLVVEMATLPIPRDTTTADTANLRAFRLAATSDPAYRRNDPRFTARFPGPTFRVRRGDLVRIRLINDLPRATPQESNEACIQPVPAIGGTIPDVFQACFHGPNYTNIHYHGMHVSPDSTSTVVGDDVLMVIAPKDTIQYSFRIPHNQSPGTHWYHPHKHGSVAIQVANGMAGAFIVEAPEMGLDSIVRSLGMVEHLIAVQQVAETVGLLSHPGELDKPPLLVNGQFRPTIYMAPGEVQRWRIVNENTTRTTKTFEVAFGDAPTRDVPRLYDAARDGVQFAPVNYDTTHPDTSLFMAPGQRLDAFVRAPLRPGRHQLQLRHVPAAGRRSRDPTLPVDATVGGARADTALILFHVVVDSALVGRNTTLPRTLPPLPDFLSRELRAASDTAIIVFTDSLNQQPSQFYLGSRLNPYQRFNDNSVFVPSDTVGRAMPMELGRVQTWKIVNNSQQLINHPFHIHINPFQVHRVVFHRDDPFRDLYHQLNAAAARGSPIWLDVLPLPQAFPDTTIQRTVTGVDSVTVNGRLVRVDSTVQVDTVINGTPNTAFAVITQKYDDFQGCHDEHCGTPAGYFVMHCHILGHEERGMMQVLQVVRPGQPVSPPEGHVSHGHPGHGQPHRH